MIFFVVARQGRRSRDPFLSARDQDFSFINDSILPVLEPSWLEILLDLLGLDMGSRFFFTRRRD